METFNCATCHNIKPLKMNNHNAKHYFIFFGNAQITGHMAKFDLTKCINIKTSIMDDANLKNYF